MASRRVFSSLMMLSLLALSPCTLAGCGNKGLDVRDTATTAGEPSATSQASATAVDAEPIEVQLVDGDQYRQVVAEHQGKVVAVDFWATWCKPCTKAFPHMVELSRQFPADQVVFVSLSMDGALSDQQKVEKYLQDVGAHGMRNLMSRLDGQASMEAFDLWSVPCYKLYDRQGKLRYQFAAREDPEHKLLDMDEFDIRLREVLAESGAPAE